VSQYFTPSDQANDNANDADFGSGGAAILVDQPSGPVQHLVIGGGKDGYLYLLNRDAMGGLGDSNAWQRFNFGNEIFSTGAFWNNTFYMAGVGGHLQAFSFNTSTGKMNALNVSQSSASFGFPGSTPSVSASGTTNGIVWALNNGTYCTDQSTGCGPAVLRAYDGANVRTELWNSTLGTGNAAGNAIKFTVPTVANGKVYVGTRGNNTGGTTSSTTIPGELDVYGLLSGATQAATPTFSPASGTYTSAASVTISVVTSGATIYYTTDGTTPSTRLDGVYRPRWRHGHRNHPGHCRSQRPLSKRGGQQHVHHRAAGPTAKPHFRQPEHWYAVTIESVCRPNRHQFPARTGLQFRRWNYREFLYLQFAHSDHREYFHRR